MQDLLNFHGNVASPMYLPYFLCCDTSVPEIRHFTGSCVRVVHELIRSTFSNPHEIGRCREYLLSLPERHARVFRTTRGIPRTHFRVSLLSLAVATITPEIIYKTKGNSADVKNTKYKEIIAWKSARQSCNMNHMQPQDPFVE